MAEVTVWHDGGCPLCQREIALMRRLDTRGAIDFVDARECEDGVCPAPKADLLERFHAREGDTVHDGAAAFAAMWRAIPVLRPFGLIARFGPVLSVLEFLYRRFLRVRPRLQRYLKDREAA